MRSRMSFVALTAWCCVACSDSTQPVSDGTIVLSAADAAMLSSRFSAMAAASPELSWLADSISTIVQAGTQATRMDFTIDGSARSFYAVSLQRQFTLANSFSTFHVVAFDNLTVADTFAIVNGYAQSGTTTPPLQASGTFGGQDVFAHLITVSGGTVTDWVADDGTALLAGTDDGTACGSISLPPNATCTTGRIGVQATIAAAHAVGHAESHSMGMLYTGGRVLSGPVIDGVVLHFTQ